MCVCFFHNFGFELEAVTLRIGVLNCNLGKWEKQRWKGLPDFDHRKVAKRKFLCLNIQGLKELGTKIRELLLFSEIGKARISSLEPRRVQRL